MRISKYGHACLGIEEGEVKLLIDPGSFSKGFEAIKWQAVLISHQHGDHMVPETIKALLGVNPEMKIYADEGSAKLLAEQQVQVQTVHEGDQFEVGGVRIDVIGRDHAVIHPDVPVIPDVGYMVADRLFYPGDSFVQPGRPVEILATPASAPWLKVSEAVDYVRAVKPRVVIPVHDAVLSEQGKGFHFSLLENLGGAKVIVIADGSSIEV